MIKNHRLILLLISLIIINCNTDYNKTKNISPVVYNNLITEVWNKAVKLDSEIDIDFYNNYYSFFDTEDSLYIAFIQKRQLQIDTLIQLAQNIPDYKGAFHP